MKTVYIGVTGQRFIPGNYFRASGFGIENNIVRLTRPDEAILKAGEVGKTDFISKMADTIFGSIQYPGSITICSNPEFAGAVVQDGS